MFVNSSMIRSIVRSKSANFHCVFKGCPIIRSKFDFRMPQHAARLEVKKDAA
jgi:hypothetical protein